ncbi:hypothetical protein E4T48_00333 [Aureobasidium sp. EXF-10727]|nr:hypothetical protein E4T48_00333 [Aureobasidium sp. EXF-10727]KAI4729736.1 hypothetical protein E4T49_02387 [Aureobasidium sp. EXF-10728]
MAASSTLPPELFQQILSLVPHAQLACCALVSKAWCKHATSLLYENIDLTWRRPLMLCSQSWDNMQLDPCPCERAGHCTIESHLEAGRQTQRHRCIMRGCLDEIACPNQSWPSLYLLARTIISSPALAGLVRHFRLAGPVPRSIWTNPNQTALSHDDLHYVRPILQCGAQMSSAGWLRLLDHGCPSAFAALALTRLPGLRTLNLGPHFQDALAILGFPLLQQIIPHVQEASVGVFEDSVRMGSGRAPHARADTFFQLLLLRLPQMRSLALNLPRPLTPYFWSDVLPQKLTTDIETLELTYTYLDEFDLAHLLRACPRLRNLKYDYWTTPPSRDPYVNGPAKYTPDRLSERLVNTQVLGRSLELVRHTLQSLHLHIVPPFDWFNQYLQTLDFSEFRALTTLHVPLQLLVSKHSSSTLVSSLPSSLRTLWLNDDGACLWLNHQLFWNPLPDYHFENDANPVFDTSYHPIHTDQEIIDVMAKFLSDWRVYVPDLQSVRLVFYSMHWSCWAERDEETIRMALQLAGQKGGVQVSVHKVHERECIHRRRSVLTGQNPPYFALQTISKGRLSKGHPWHLNIDASEDGDTAEP